MITAGQHKNISSPYSVTAKYLLFFLLVVSPLLRGSVHLWHHTLIELVSLFIVFVLLLEKTITAKPSRQKVSLDRPILAMLVLCLISFLYSQARHDSIEALALLLSCIAIFYSTIYSIRSRQDELQLVYVICGIGLLLSVIGLSKYFGISLPFWVYDELDYPDFFISGVFGNHNHMAGYLEMVIPFLLVLFLTRTRTGPVFIVLLTSTVLVISSHVLTLSRGGWISLVLSLSFMAIVLMFHRRFRRKKLLALIFCFFSVVLFFVFSGSDLFLRALSMTDEETILGMNGRVIIWKGTLTMIKDNLMIGTGPGTFSTIFPQFQPPGLTARFYYAHNDYLHYLSELGVLFIPILGWLLFALFKAGSKKLQSSSRQIWGFTLGAMTGIVAILCHSLVDFNLHIPANALLFTVLAAVVVRNSRGSRGQVYTQKAPIRVI